MSPEKNSPLDPWPWSPDAVKRDRPEAGPGFSRRAFLQSMSLAAAALGLRQVGEAAEAEIQGFDYRKTTDIEASQGWKPVSDRRLRVGLVGHGYCKFAATFSFQDHPNVEVVAVSDLIPERCAEMAKATRCAKTCPSLEEMVKDDRIEAIFLATDAPNHAKHSMEVLRHGKHVGVAVPAVYGENALEEAEQLLQLVKSTGLAYMMFETSCFHRDANVDLYAMRQLYRAGALGKLLYSEGEYYHFKCEQLPSYKDWRICMPPLWYPTHNTAYHIGVSGESFTEVSCFGPPSPTEALRTRNNQYKNPFGTEVAMFRASGGGVSRQSVSWDSPGHDWVRGRVRGEKGSFYGKYEGLEKNLPDLRRPPLPPGMSTHHHGGSHGYLTDEFVASILQQRKPLVDVVTALNMSVAGVVAHQSALKDGERLKIPQYTL